MSGTSRRPASSRLGAAALALARARAEPAGGAEVPRRGAERAAGRAAAAVAVGRSLVGRLAYTARLWDKVGDVVVRLLGAGGGVGRRRAVDKVGDGVVRLSVGEERVRGRSEEDGAEAPRAKIVEGG